MNILVVLVLCLLMYNLHSHHGVKSQKGRGYGVEDAKAHVKSNMVFYCIVAAVVLICIVVGLVLVFADNKTCKDVKTSCGTGKKFKGPEDKKCENTTKCKEKCCEDKTCADFEGDCETTEKLPTTKCTKCDAKDCCEKAGGGGEEVKDTGPYIKYDKAATNPHQYWGPDKPCSPMSDWKDLVKLETDPSNKAVDEAVICPISSADANGQCTGDCVDDCQKHYGEIGSGVFGPCYVMDGKTMRGDKKCVITGNPDYRIYDNDKCI